MARRATTRSAGSFVCSIPISSAPAFSASWRGSPKPLRVSSRSTARSCAARSTRPAASRRCIWSPPGAAISASSWGGCWERAGGMPSLLWVPAGGCDPPLSVAPVATGAKSNEITAVPRLLEMLSLKGTIVTVDALNCQRDIARRIVAQGGDYVLALKGNQATLHSDVTLFLDDPETRPTDVHTTVDGDHGRIETRTCTVSTDIGWLQEVHDWPGLAAIGKVIRTRETGAKVTTETAYYLLSTPLSAERFGHVARSHWAVENSLHWCLDVIMNEDNARNRLDNGPYNLAILRHMALNLIRKEPSKGSLRVKIKRAGWKDAYLAKVLAQI